MASPLTQSIFVGSEQNPMQILRMLFHDRHASGPYRFVESLRVPSAVSVRQLVPDGWEVERSVRSGLGVAALVGGDGATALIEVYAEHANVHVAAETHDAARHVVDSLRRRRLGRTRTGTTPMSIWHLDPRIGPVSRDRTVETPTWPSIRRNYTPAAAAALDRLHAVRRPSTTAKLVLLHGPPGTGKTTALRSLARSWRPWCRAMYISDPETFFGDPRYIAEVMSTPVGTLQPASLDRPATMRGTWRLVIAEDADEYLRATARRDAGAALGRLLNLADGVLGHGTETVVLLTTNEDLARIHPAVARPGRALASIEFGLFDRTQAATWLGEAAPPPAKAVSLAELFQLRGDLDPIGSQPPAPAVGQYL